MQPPIWTIKCQFEVQSIQVLMAEAKKLSQKEKKSNKIENTKTIQVSLNQYRSGQVIFPSTEIETTVKLFLSQPKEK